MKKRILVDSSFLFARYNSRDSCFERAHKIQSLLDKKMKNDEFILGMNVYSEILTLVSQRMGKEDALNLIPLLNSAYELFNPDEDTYIRADSYFRRTKSKNVSYSDCISFAIMDQENIDFVLSFDEHFKQMGFKRFGIDR